MKYINYLKYLLKHKWYVMIECFNIGLYWRGLIHDCSKFRLSEFISYAQHFYGEYPSLEDLRDNHAAYFQLQTKETVAAKFDTSWLKHIHRNKHHWQHWILICDDSYNTFRVLCMPVDDVKEMVCDWIGAGKAIKGDGGIDECRAWYLERKDRIILHGLSRMLVHKMLGIKDEEV